MDRSQKEHAVLGNWKAYGLGTVSFFSDGTVSIESESCNWQIENKNSVKIECSGAGRFEVAGFSINKSDTSKAVLHFGDGVNFERVD